MNNSSPKGTNDTAATSTASVTPTADSPASVTTTSSAAVSVDSTTDTASTAASPKAATPTAATPTAATPTAATPTAATPTAATPTAATPKAATLNIPSLSARSSLVASPIVMTHADYRRPSSSVSVLSIPKAEDYGGLPRSICGTIFLFCHFLIAMLLVVASIIDLSLNGLGIIKPEIRTVSEVWSIFPFLLSILIFACIVITIKIPVVLLFGSSKAFKSNCYKKHTGLMIGSIGMILGGFLCLLMHSYLASRPVPNKYTSYLAGGMFLILHGLMSFRLFWELQNGVDQGSVIMLPYCLEEIDNGQVGVDLDTGAV